MYKAILYIITSVVLLSCSSTNKQEDKIREPYVWRKLVDSAAWEKSYNFQLFATKDSAYTFHPDGVWASANGKDWIKTALGNPIHNHAFLDYVEFNHSILGLGFFEGNIEQNQFKPIIFQTKNWQSWDTLSTTSNLPDRYFYHPFIFQNKIWIIGGENKFSKYADIWNSIDGVQWAKQKDNLPFGKRSGSSVVILRDSLYMLNNDVWRSADGLNWEKINAEIIPGEEVFGYAALTFDNKIWLMGCNRNGQFSSQVLFSDNGKTWQTLDAPWLPRGGIAATVFKDKIIMTGGKYGGTPNHPDFRYDNDVWVLEKNL